MDRKEQPADTNIGGQARVFPSTCWSQVTHGSRDPLGLLAQSYWKPIYAYVRTRWAKSNEDAKDLTQAFFVWMMESEFIQRADRDRGRFRAFVKVALEHFLTDEYRRQSTRKRGGDHRTFSIDGLNADLARLDLPDPANQQPEHVLDEVWRTELFGRALDALEKECREADRSVQFAVFKEYCLEDTDGMDYEEIAGKHGTTKASVANFIFRSKKRFREILTDLVSETVEGSRDLEEELRQLFGDIVA